MGRGGNHDHKKVKRDEEESVVPRVSLDYFVLSEEAEGADDNPMVLMADERTGEKLLEQSIIRDWPEARVIKWTG